MRIRRVAEENRFRSSAAIEIGSVTDRPDLGDPEFYRSLGSSVYLLSWRQGEWEDIILSQAARAGSASDLLFMLRT